MKKLFQWISLYMNQSRNANYTLQSPYLISFWQKFASLWKRSNGKTISISTFPKKTIDPKELDEQWVKRIKLQPIFEEKVYKNMHIILYSYCGKNYYGSQRQKNKDELTIENKLLSALLQSKILTESEHFSPNMVKWQSVSRTDRGVSAACQLNALYMEKPDSIEECVQNINQYLPNDIRVFDIIPTIEQFSRKKCDARTYSYLTPTFAFAPAEKISSEEYRMCPNVHDRLNKFLQLFNGTHFFHNFTNGIEASNPKSLRRIRNISCSDPFLRENIEWVRINIAGDSFMKHQIRKMMGLSMAYCKDIVQSEICLKLLDPTIVCNLPISPGLGLVLDGPVFSNYKRKYPEMRFNFEENEEMKSFRESNIDRAIVNGEKEDKTTLRWLPTLFLHSYDTSLNNVLDDRNDSPLNRAKVNLILFKSELEEQTRDQL